MSSIDWITVFGQLIVSELNESVFETPRGRNLCSLRVVMTQGCFAHVVQAGNMEISTCCYTFVITALLNSMRQTLLPNRR